MPTYTAINAPVRDSAVIDRNNQRGTLFTDAPENPYNPYEDPLMTRGRYLTRQGGLGEAEEQEYRDAALARPMFEDLTYNMYAPVGVGENREMGRQAPSFGVAPRVAPMSSGYGIPRDMSTYEIMAEKAKNLGFSDFQDFPAPQSPPQSSPPIASLPPAPRPTMGDTTQTPFPIKGGAPSGVDYSTPSFTPDKGFDVIAGGPDKGVIFGGGTGSAPSGSTLYPAPGEGGISEPPAPVSIPDPGAGMSTVKPIAGSFVRPVINELRNYNAY